MELTILTELLDLKSYKVKDLKKNGIFLTLEKTGGHICPKCGEIVLDHIKDKRSFTVEDLSIFGNRTFLQFEKYRISCSCGYNGTEKIEWLTPYAKVTNRYAGWIYAFCKRMTCLDVARVFKISEYKVLKIDKAGIKKELKKQPEVKPSKISIDEVSRKKGHNYATIVTAPNEKKVLDVIKGRKIEDLDSFFEQKDEKWLDNIKIVTMDAWRAFKTSTNKFCKNAKISYDHFHIAQYFGKAIDQLRIREMKDANETDKKAYKGSKWLLLKNSSNLKEKQTDKLKKLLLLNQNLSIAYILRDEFRQIYKGKTIIERLFLFRQWKKKMTKIDIPELKEFYRKITNWSGHIENALTDKSSNGYAEGINAKIRVVQRMAYGYKDFEYLRLKILQQFNFRELNSIFDG